ncbi:AbiH family protein [Acinetobacter sp.]|uniref:AbiH family protein n=1 Tax=Acinetobacter sp. TaxID=472 RepID=UPI0038909E6E
MFPEAYYRNNDKNLDINISLIFSKLEKSLRKFIEIFNWYLVSIIQSLHLKSELIKNTLGVSDENIRIYSFNYTSTFKRLYRKEMKIEFLHGQCGKSQNIVLGISDLKNDLLKKYKNYGFTKYHQKLLKNTNYVFLREDKHLIDIVESKGIGATEINIFIWGHSLADSDENYIQEIFSFNETRNVKFILTVFYYGSDDFSLLNNLLDILDKEKVEKWMKKGWLKFEKNPDIAKLNNIQPIELPKFEEA